MSNTMSVRAGAISIRLNGWPLFWSMVGAYLAMLGIWFAATDLGPLFTPYLVDKPVNSYPVVSIIRFTWRCAAVFFLASFCASSLLQLWRTPVTRWLMANRRYFGLAFAVCVATQMVTIFTVLVPQRPQFLGLGIVHFWGQVVYLNVTLIAALTVTSFPSISRRIISPRNWRILHKGAMLLLGAYFMRNYVTEDMRNPNVVQTIFAIAFIAAWVLRFVAWRQKVLKCEYDMALASPGRITAQLPFMTNRAAPRVGLGTVFLGLGVVLLGLVALVKFAPY